MAKISTVIGIGAELSAGFSQTFRGVDSALAGTAGTAKKLNAAVGQIAGYRKLQDTLPKTADKVEAAKAKLASLKGQLAAAGGSSVDLTNNIGDQEAKLRDLERAYQRDEAAMRNSSEALRAAGVDMTQLASEEKRLAAEVEKATVKLKAQAAVKGGIANLKNSMGQLRSAAMISAAAITAAGFALERLIGGTARAGDEAAKTGATLNMSGKALQQWQFIGARAGISAEEMVKHLEKLNETVDDAALNGGKAREVLGELNLDPDTLRAASATDRIQMIGTAMQNYHGRMSQASITQALFGKQALRMQAVLGMTIEDQRKLAIEAERSGYAQTEAQTKAAEAYMDSMASLKIAIEGARNQFGSQLMPIATATLGWITRNTWAIKTAFVAVAATLAIVSAVSMVKLGSATVSAYRDVRSLIAAMRTLGAVSAVSGKGGMLSSILSGAKAIIPWLTGIATTVMPMLVGAVTTGATMIGAAISAIPIVGWIALAVTAIGFLIYKFWTPIKTFCVALGKAIAAPFIWSFQTTVKGIKWFASVYMSALRMLKTVGTRMLDHILAPFRAVRAAIKWIGGTLGLTGGQTGEIAQAKMTAQTQQTQAALAQPRTLQPVANPTSIQGRRGGAVPVTQNNAITINAQPGQSPEQIAQAAIRELDKRDRNRARIAFTDQTPAFAGGAA